MDIPIEIQRSDDEKERFRIAIPIGDMIGNKISADELQKISKDYLNFIISCRKMIEITKKKSKSGDPLLKWELSNFIYTFIKALHERGYIVTKLAETLARDLRMSKRHIDYIIEFRETYPKLESVNPKISWDRYKELLDIPNPELREKVEKMLKQGKMTGRKELRRYKKENM